MARVEVELVAARERRLPLVSVRSGRRADGYAPAGSPPGTVAVPLTQEEFDRLLDLRRRQRSGLALAPVFLVLGLAFARYPVLLPLGIVTAGVSLALWGAAALAVRRLLPDVRVDEARGRVELRRVHRRFAEVVSRPGA